MLSMHAVMLSTRPTLRYWNAGTMQALETLAELRHGGTQVFATIDAGPQVKAVCSPTHADDVHRALRDLPLVLDTFRVGLGPGAHLI